MGRRHELRGARMLITGASQGIGRALALAALDRGVRVLGAARSKEELEKLHQEGIAKGGELQTVVADVTLPEDRQRMLDATLQYFGGLDILVNNAGIGATGHFAEAGPERLRKIMEVNFFGLTETTRLCLPALKQSHDPVIVNISSTAGKRGIPARSDYSASKFAVQGFSEALRTEIAKDGIDLLVVCPGLTRTNFSQNMLEQKAKLQLDHMRGMTSEQVAEAVLEAIAHGRREVCLGWQGRLIIFVNRFFPRLADRIAARRVRALFRDEIAARRQTRAQSVAGPTISS
jgi:short-subunit dehydrogenase